MSKYYRRGKFKNNYILVAQYGWPLELTAALNTLESGVLFSNKMGSRANFIKALIVRGIGYRVFALSNDFSNSVNVGTSFIDKMRPVYSGDDLDPVAEIRKMAIFDFPYSRYVLVRAGHTRDLVLPLGIAVQALTSKKDRKLAVSSSNAIVSANVVKKIFSYRPPSVYTGRGVRIKHEKLARKAGKKDKQKGKAF